MQKNIFLFLTSLIIFLLMGDGVFAEGFSIPGGDKIKDVSIQGGSEIEKVNVDSARNFGLSLLGVARMIISGVALIYMVIIGANMVMFSDTEEDIKKQRMQIIYTLVGFLFINTPTIIYDVFYANDGSSRGEFTGGNSDWSSIGVEGAFWNMQAFDGFIGNLLNFFRVFIFALSVIVFTWSAFEFIARMDEEKKKNARHRMLYGILGLIFLGFVEVWARLVAAPKDDGKSIMQNVTDLAGEFFGIGFFFAAPTAIFFLFYGAYYYFTAAGDEDRMKKGKTIIINTVIAVIILISAMSFLTEIIKF